MESRKRTLAELATLQPAATRVFLRHRLDFCCGGHRSLGDACDAAGLDAAQIVREIEYEVAHGEDGPNWETRSADELIEHIVWHHHEGMRRDFPPLVEAARKVERVHAAKPAVPDGLANELDAFWSEMQSHMAKEEQVLFPAIRRGARGPQVYMPVRMMQIEHDAHAKHFERVRQLTGDLETPVHACATWRALYEGLRANEADSMRHIHLENNILFLRAARSV
jgi:regulator of cell morphogenesis and NO signaling